MEHAHARLHALDGLRAAMMLLGLVLHSTISYGVVDYGAAWPYNDPATTFVVDLIFSFIHVFRMPVFFVLAGFFAALIYLRRGAGGLARNRATRVVVPFAVGWVILYPLVIGGFIFANAEKSDSLAIGFIKVIVSQSGVSGFFGDTTLHLWFLYDLIFFYLAALGLAPLVGRLPAALRGEILRAFESVVSRPLLRILVPALLTAVTLLPMGGWLRISTSFMPDPPMLGAYGVFFGFGWLLCLKRNLLASFERLAWTQTLVGVVLLVHPVNGEVPPVKGRPWKLPHYANRGKTSSSRGELASARSCFSTVRTALGKLRITGLLARFDVARSFPQFPRPLLLQPTIWTSERGADLGSGRCQPRPHLVAKRRRNRHSDGAQHYTGLLVCA